MLRAPVGHLLDELQQDVRFGARSLLRSPGFAAVAILTMAVGIGATTTIFSLVNGILLRPLPYQDPDRLVVVWPENWFSTNLFLEIEPFLDSFEAAAGHTASNHTLITDDGAVRVQGPQVTARFLDLLRPRLQLGRGFAPRAQWGAGVDAGRGAPARERRPGRLGAGVSPYSWPWQLGGLWA